MTPDDLAAHLLARLHEVRSRLGAGPKADARSRFADALDSMGLVEFVGVVADDCGVEPTDVEEAAGRRFSTIEDLARDLYSAGILPVREAEARPVLPVSAAAGTEAWLAA